MRIACVQANVAFANPAANAEAAIRKLRDLKSRGVDLAVFPEAYLTGYCVSNPDEAESIAIPRESDQIRAIQNEVDALGIGAVVGFAEQGVEGELYNAAAICEPGVPTRFYRKTHLPFLGYDRFSDPGAELPIFDTRWGKIGVLVCFDLRPPEAARTLALKGAELIVLPTNWPVGAEVSADHVSIARAAENKVFFATCNRVGTENGTTFIGHSRIISTSGKVLAEAGANEETIVADLDLAEARQKRIVNIPGEYEMEVFATRQPNLYLPITDTNRR
jgi:predicted amidohydrolase